MSNITVLILGHFIIGLLFGWKELFDKKNVESTLKEYLAKPDIDDRKKELAVKVLSNKPFMLTCFALMGYFHFYWSVKNLFKKKRLGK